MIDVGVVGGTGYTGVEVLRLLALHKHVNVKVVTSRSDAGVKVSDAFPNLRGHFDVAFEEPSLSSLSTCDLVFFATPNGAAMKMTPDLLEAGVKVIDLAADFRIKDIDVWQQWYGMEHACPDVVAEAVYGLPELNRADIANARVVANPGCYPTAVTLGMLPLLENHLVDVDHLIADVKSGVSGAGRGANVGGLYCETSDSFRAYSVNGHRHQPEIVQTLSKVMGESVGLTFVPHLVPMIRGIEATLYGRVAVDDVADVQRLYESRYADEAFVDVLPERGLPETRSVKGSNLCRMAVYRPQNGSTLVVTSVIDNLMKGAAGQAIQNMNIMFGWAEDEGLRMVALMP